MTDGRDFGPALGGFMMEGQQIVIVDSFLKAWENFGDDILSMLPDSPTVDSAALQALADYAGYINYWVPVGPFLTFFSGLLASVGVYYMAMVILRWLKVIA